MLIKMLDEGKEQKSCFCGLRNQTRFCRYGKRFANRGCCGSSQMPGVQTSLLGARTVPREERSLLQAPAHERR